MKYMAIIDADEKPVSCKFIGCNGNVAPYLIGETTNIKPLENQPKTIQEKQADSEKYQKAYDDGYDDGYAQARFDFEPKTGHWILADEQNKEDVENDNYRFICSECQCSDIHAKDTIVPYCWKCGAKMVEPQESEEV